MGKKSAYLVVALFSAVALSAGAQTYGFMPVFSSVSPQKDPSFQVVNGTRGAAAGLRITPCETESYSVDPNNPFDATGASIRFYVDVVDAQGNVVNDLVLDQSIEVTLDLAESGANNPSAYLQGEYSYSPYTSILSDATGIELYVADTESENVILQASATGLTDAPSVTVHFNQGGSIAGTITVPTGTAAQMLTLAAENLSNPDISASTFLTVLPGPIPVPLPYQFSGLPAGNYVITISVLYGTGTGSHLKPLCESNSTLRPVVVAGEETSLGNYTMEVQPAGGVTGQIALEGQSSLTGTAVTVVASPVDENACLDPQALTVVLNNAGLQSDGNQYSLPFLPPGQYDLNAFGSTSPLPTALWALAAPVRVTVPASGSVTQNLTLPLSSGTLPSGGIYFTLLYKSPVEFAGAGAQPALNWANDLTKDPRAAGVSLDLSQAKYTLTVEDRCGRTAWARTGIVAPGTADNLSVTYAAAATGTDQVSPANLGAAPYYQQPLVWSVMGTILSTGPNPTATPAPTATVGPTASPTLTPSPSATPTITSSPTPNLPAPVNEILLDRNGPYTQPQLTAADANGDGVIDIADLILFLSNL